MHGHKKKYSKFTREYKGNDLTPVSLEPKVTQKASIRANESSWLSSTGNQ